MSLLTVPEPRWEDAKHVKISDFGSSWENVSTGLPDGDITTIAVNCNGTAVYAGVREEGLFAAIANSVSQVPLDATTDVEYGSSVRNR